MFFTWERKVKDRNLYSGAVLTRIIDQLMPGSLDFQSWDDRSLTETSCSLTVGRRGCLLGGERSGGVTVSTIQYNGTMVHTSHVLYCPSVPVCLLTPLVSSPSPPHYNPLQTVLTVLLTHCSSWGGTHSGCLTEADWDQDRTGWSSLSSGRMRRPDQPPLLGGRLPPSNNQPLSGPLSLVTLQRIILTWSYQYTRQLRPQSSITQCPPLPLPYCHWLLFLIPTLSFCIRTLLYLVTVIWCNTI